MPKFKVPVEVRTVVEVAADSGSEAEDIVNARAAEFFPSPETRVETDTPSVKSAYEVSVTFYMDAFTHEEVEDRVYEIVRKGIGDKGAKGTGEVGFDIESIKQGGPCRG